MTFATRILYAVVTLMSVVNHSYLKVVLPKKDHITFDLYISETTNDLKLNEEQFKQTKTNFDKIMADIKNNANYKQILSELPDINEKAADFLTRMDKMIGCGEGLRSIIEKHIKKRYDDSILNNKHVTENQPQNDIHMTIIQEESTSSPSTVTDLTEISPDKKDAKYIEELQFLSTLIPLSSSSGRLRSIYLNTVYVDVQHKKAGDLEKFFSTIWFILLNLPDPMFGEAYISYAIRMIKKDLMPLPQNLIPLFYGKGDFKIHDDFSIWPELNSVYVMYYLFQCPVQKIVHDDSSSHGKSVSSTASTTK